MPYLNKVFLMGNLTRDPELRQVSGIAYCSFGMAINRQFQSARGEMREESCFVEVETWNKSAEVAAQYLRKGRPVFVEGRLRYDQWDDRETGKKRSRLIVRADRVQFVDSPSGGASSGDAPRAAASVPRAADYGNAPQPPPPPSRPAAPAFQQPPAAMPAFEGMPDMTSDDEIPF